MARLFREYPRLVVVIAVALAALVVVSGLVGAALDGDSEEAAPAVSAAAVKRDRDRLREQDRQLGQARDAADALRRRVEAAKAKRKREGAALRRRARRAEARLKRLKQQGRKSSRRTRARRNPLAGLRRQINRQRGR